MNHIEEIKLAGMLPRVFETEDVPASDVWETDLTLKRGGRYMIEAASGGGKSSLCAYIYGSRTDYAGTLTFDGVDTRRLGVDQWQEIRRRHIALLPQELDLFPELTALENVSLKNRLTGHVADKQIDLWFEMLGIASRRDYPVGRMSIGQQQRVAVIRALCQPFDFIFLDEPVSHLDENNNRVAAGLISSEASRQGAAIVATSVGNPIHIEGMKRLRL